MKKIRYGYTLAEVLIVVIVIGVLATILLPMFGNLRPNQEQIMLKKAYYLVGRNVTELINDDELYAETDTENTSGFANVLPVKYHGETYTGDTKFCKLFAEKMNLKNGYSCQSKNISTAFPKGTKAADQTFVTADGMVWILPISNFSSKQYIYVDVNGEKTPNCFSGYLSGANIAANQKCSVKEAPDRFAIEVDNLGRLNRTLSDKVSQRYLEFNKTTKSYKDLYNEGKFN